MSSEKRREYIIKITGGTPGLNQAKLQEELDAFWTYAAEIKDYTTCGNSHTSGQVYRIEALESFGEAFIEENQLDVPFNMGARCND